MALFDHFESLDIRTGTILQAEVFAEARKPAYKLIIDFGLLGIKKSSAQITVHYQPEALIGKQIIAVVNFPVKQIGPFMSECLVLGVYDKDGGVILLTTDKTVQNGQKIG
ncbi:MAG: tRNA-binding protein [Flavobacteriaceae bacterium]|nr:tRNA-binding protein [Flavobacteriaceae bacterium]